MIPFYPNTGSDDPLAFALAFALPFALPFSIDGLFPTGYPQPASPHSGGSKNELNKKWTYFDAKMPLNSFPINKITSQPWSNFVEFRRF
jgi:hypothetical protein